MPVTREEHARRTAAKRFNACVFLAAGTFNLLVLAVLIAAIFIPVIESKDAMAALTPTNGIVAAWCFVLHLFGYAMVQLSKAG